MKFITRNLPFVAAACVTAMIGLSAVTAFGGSLAFKGFCENNNWSSNDRVSYSDFREMNVAAGGVLAVDAGRNGGISVKGENRGDVLVRACVQAWDKTETGAKSIAAGVRINTAGTIKADNSTDEKNWSVSYELIVPISTDLKLNAHNGGISIYGVDGSGRI